MINRWRCQESFCSQAQYSLTCRFFNIQNILRKTIIVWSQRRLNHSLKEVIFAAYDPSGGWHSPQIMDNLRRIVTLGCHSLYSQNPKFQAINTQNKSEFRRRIALLRGRYFEVACLTACYGTPEKEKDSRCKSWRDIGRQSSVRGSIISLMMVHVLRRQGLNRTLPCLCGCPVQGSYHSHR